MIGDPISHSLSPVIHNAAFGAMGLDFVSVACPVPDGAAPTAVAGMRALGLRGLSVTMPHKAAVLAELDRLTPVATALGAVNCISRDPEDDAVLVGDNTDGDGFLRGLQADFGLDPAGARCVVLGAGERRGRWSWHWPGPVRTWSRWPTATTDGHGPPQTWPAPGAGSSPVRTWPRSSPPRTWS